MLWASFAPARTALSRLVLDDIGFSSKVRQGLLDAATVGAAHISPD
jgi:hypothetical protein